MKRERRPCVECGGKTKPRSTVRGLCSACWSREYRRLHRDDPVYRAKAVGYSRKHRAKNPYRCSRRFRRENDPEKYKTELERGRTYQSKHRFNQRLEAMKMISNNSLRCVNCGCDKYEILEINHKNGGGKKEMIVLKAFDLPRLIVQNKYNIDNLEITCRVCNILHYIEKKHGKLPIRVIWNG